MVFEVSRYAHGWYLKSQGMPMDGIWSHKVCLWMVFEVPGYAHGWYLKSQGMPMDSI